MKNSIKGILANYVLRKGTAIAVGIAVAAVAVSVITAMRSGNEESTETVEPAEENETSDVSEE